MRGCICIGAICFWSGCRARANRRSDASWRGVSAKTFVDADAELERKLGVTIPTIFEIEGEASFRDREEAVLAELTTLSNIVLATGGGVVIRPANRERLKANGTVVYLHAMPETLRERTRRSRHRPLLNAADPMARLAELYAVRDPLYREVAAIVVESNRERDRALLAAARGGAAGPAAGVTGMRTQHVALGERSYAIHVGPGLLREAGALLAPLLPRPRVVIVSNPVVAAHWLAPLRASLSAAGIDSESILVPDGETHKSWSTLHDVLTRLLELNAERSTTLVALGGGVVGDIAGFAAAIYQRGMPFVQVPTTLLAQVDSSVGGKTGVNHPLGKNMIGAFHQPRAVVIDTDCLATLPRPRARRGARGSDQDRRDPRRRVLRMARGESAAPRRARRRCAGPRGGRELPDQGGDRRRRRARGGRARAAQLRPHVRPRDRSRAWATANGCTARRWPRAWCWRRELSAAARD